MFFYENQYHKNNENGEEPDTDVPKEQWIQSERFFEEMDEGDENCFGSVIASFYFVSLIQSKYLETKDDKWDTELLCPSFEEAVGK